MNLNPIKVMVIFIKSLLTGKQTNTPEPRTYSSLWNIVIVMSANERDKAFDEGFALSIVGTEPHVIETGQRLMQIISMIQICVDTLGEERGIEMAKKEVAGMYADR